MSLFRMPALGADMEWGIVTDWLKEPGEDVKRGDIIAVVETQKGAIEIEVFEDGVLDEIKVAEGTKVPVGDVLAVILSPGETRSEEPPATETGAPPPAPEPPPEPVDPSAPAEPVAPLPRAETQPTPPSGARLKVTPVARREAERRGLDLASLSPGGDGVIGLRQLDGTATAPAKKPSKPAGFDRDEMRKVIAAAMARSKREIPHYYVTHTVDMTALMDWLARENESRSVAERLLYAAPLIKATALALQKTKDLNGHFENGVFRPSDAVHVGMATAIRGGGLVAPAIHDADKLDLNQLMDKLRDLVSRVRGGRLKSSEMMDPTVTLSNLGEDTVDSMLPVIYPPQVAIIGCGAVGERPWIMDGAVVARQMMTVSVAGDHRVSDGRVAANFLQRFDKLLQQPEAL